MLSDSEAFQDRAPPELGLQFSTQNHKKRNSTDRRRQDVKKVSLKHVCGGTAQLSIQRCGISKFRIQSAVQNWRVPLCHILAKSFWTNFDVQKSSLVESAVQNVRSGFDIRSFQDSPLSLGNVFVLETAFKYFYHFQFNWGWQALL